MFCCGFSKGIGAFQQRHHLGFAQHAAFDQLDVVDLHASSSMRVENAAWSRRGAADVRMMTARADIKGRQVALPR